MMFMYDIYGGLKEHGVYFTSYINMLALDAILKICFVRGDESRKNHKNEAMGQKRRVFG